MISGRGDHRGFPYSTRPTGWFQLGWSEEFTPGDVQSFRYFGRDLVAYRGESGQVHLFDAYCPHFGAHLGHGGAVEGDDIVCPFHGWTFGGDGKNTSVPYSKRDHSGARLSCWTVREDRGIVYFWHDVNRLPPQWDPPVPVTDTTRYHPVYPGGTKRWHVRLYPQFVVENAVDCAHFPVVHRSAFSSTIEVMGAEETHILKARHQMTFGGDKPTTWLTPTGPVAGHLEGEWHGVGLGIARFLGVDGAVSLVGITPVDDESSIFFMSTWVERRGDSNGEIPRAVRKRAEEQFKQAERDFPIWENMRFTEKVPFTPEEAPGFKALRQWVKRFYPGEEEYEQHIRGRAVAAGRA